MKAKTLNYLFVIFFAGFIFLVFLKPGCNSIETDITIDTSTFYDTVTFYDTIQYYDSLDVKPSIEIQYVEIPADVDTLNILRDFFAHVFRNDTLVNDSNLFVSLAQEITENDVVSQIVTINDYVKVDTITKTVEITKTVHVQPPNWYVGAYAAMIGDSNSIGASIMYKTNKNLYVVIQAGTNDTYLVTTVIPISSIFNRKK